MAFNAQMLFVVVVLSAVHDVTSQVCLSNKTCNGHGFCPSTCGSTCTCTGDYTGDFCLIPPLCTVGGNECGQFGECNNCSSPSRSTCQCNSGYTGRLCTIAPICTDGGNECLNGGYCDFTQTPFRCQCSIDYTGISPICGAHHVTYYVTLLILCPLWSFLQRYQD